MIYFFMRKLIIVPDIAVLKQLKYAALMEATMIKNNPTVNKIDEESNKSKLR